MREVRLPAAVALASVVWFGLLAEPAAAHAAGSSGDPGGIDPRAVALGLAITAVAVVAGPSLTGRRPVRRVRGALGTVAALGAAAMATTAGLTRPAVVVAIASVVAWWLAPARSRWRAAPTVVLLVAVAGGAEGSVDVVERTLAVAHVIGAALWLAAIAEVAVAWWTDGAADGRRAARTVAGPAAVLVAVVFATGTWNTAAHLGDAGLALGTWWGRLLAVKVAVVVVVAVAAVLLRRAWVPQTEAVLLGGVAVVGLVLAAVGGPLSGAAPTGPLFVAAGTGDGLVVVTPLTPGENLIVARPSTEATTVVVDGEAVELVLRDDGVLAASVDLPAGQHEIVVAGLRYDVTVRPDDADVVPATLPALVADPDCLDRLAGAAAATAALTAAGRPTRLDVTIGGDTCGVVDNDGDDDPAEVVAQPPAGPDRSGDGALDGPVDAGADAERPAVAAAGATSASVADAAVPPLVMAAQALAARGNPAPPTVITDGSARSEAAAAAVVAARPDTAVLAAADVAFAPPEALGPGPILVATDRAVAPAIVEAVTAATQATVPVVLAPWLLDADLLAGFAERGTFVMVAVERDPTSATAVDYRTAATSLTGGPTPTAAGLAGYVEVLEAITGRPADDPHPGVFGLSRLAILPTDLDPHPSESGWAPGVALVRVA